MFVSSARLSMPTNEISEAVWPHMQKKKKQRSRINEKENQYKYQQKYHENHEVP